MKPCHAIQPCAISGFDEDDEGFGKSVLCELCSRKESGGSSKNTSKIQVQKTKTAAVTGKIMFNVKLSMISIDVVWAYLKEENIFITNCNSIQNNER